LPDPPSPSSCIESWSDSSCCCGGGEGDIFGIVCKYAAEGRLMASKQVEAIVG
jgi:hypothetical protein